MSTPTIPTIPVPPTLSTKIKVLVAYHADCIDGFTSCWVAARALQRGGYEVDTLALKYDKESEGLLLEELSKERYRELFVVDSSLPTHLLATIARSYPAMRAIILDHHKTAFEKYAPDLEFKETTATQLAVHSAHVVLNNDECGASLCWKWFHTQEVQIPTLVQYAKDYDLWRFTLGEQTKWINKYLTSQQKTLETWDALDAAFEHPQTLGIILADGKKLQEAHDEEVAKVVERAFAFTLKGIPCLAVECEPLLTSDVGHLLAMKCGTFGAMYQIDAEKKGINWSLRSNGDYDVSAIAKQFGGGGHKNAAGFQSSMDYLEKSEQEGEVE